MKNPYNNQLKYFSFNKKINSVTVTCRGIAFSSLSCSSMASRIISRPSLVQNKKILNFTTNKYGLINSHTHFSKQHNENKFHSKVDKVIDYNSRFMLIIFIINSIILIAIILLQLYASSEFLRNIDEYIKVHYFLTNINKSILLIIPFIPKNYKLVYNIRKENNRIFLDKYNKGINTSSIQNYNKKNDIDSVNNLISPEITDNKKEIIFSDSPLNLVNKQSESNESKKRSFHLSQNTTKLSLKTKNLTEGDWREIWSRKFKTLLRLGFYTPDL